MKRIIILLIFIIPEFSYAADLKLNVKDALKLFREKSRLVKILKSEEEAKSYLIEKARSSKLPSLDLDVSYNLLNDEPKSKTPFGNLPLGQDRYLKGQLILSHLIYDFGLRDSIIDKAVLDKEMTNFYLNKELNDGSLNVVFVVNQLLLASKILEVHTEELRLLNEQKKRIDSFYSEGLVTKNDVLQIDVEISNTKQKILSIQNEIANQRERLKVLLNINEDIDVEDSDIEEELLTKEKAIYEKRMEVLIAQKLVALKDLELKSAEAERYPKFYGALGLNYEENKYRTSDQNAFLSLGLKVNIFDGKSNLSERLSLLKAKQEYEEKVRQAKDMVRLEVVQAMNDLKTAMNKIDVAKTVIIQAKENLLIEEGRYNEQLITATDLIAATLRLSRANLNYNEAIYSYKNACYRFLWAKGELYTY